jgi:homoserine dehydrogenase
MPGLSNQDAPAEVRIWIVGLGTVGRWVERAVSGDAGALARDNGLSFSVVGSATGRGGFQSADGQHWDSSLEGMRATDADVLVETAASPMEGEPGASHMREALQRGIPVVTSNKWPVARFGVELRDLARENRTAFRAESTVMSGTPLVGPLTEGLAGATPHSLRGVVNATANSILTNMASGASYTDALSAAQDAGLAEPDPGADVDGHDSVAKAMILSGLVFGRGLDLEEVERRGISELSAEELHALARGGCVREVTSLEFEKPGGRGGATARVRPEIIAAEDPLARIDGTMCCVVAKCDPLGEIRIAGPGAGPELAGQGVLSDLIRVSRDLQSRRT